MNKFRFTIKILAIATFMFAFASLAQAQATRTWVSGVGDDANPCSRTAPCKTFAGAISKTAPGGEIDALDPGGFGAVTITKAITIDGTGTMAGILNSLTNGVIVNAGANDIITLRGLSIQGVGNGINGIRYLAGKGLNVLDCIIQGQTTHGIDMNMTTFGNLVVRNTVIKKCAGDGISVFTTATPLPFARVLLENSAFLENGNGVHGKAGARITARNCQFAQNTNNGVFADSNSPAAAASIRVWDSSISLNQVGALAGNSGNTGQSIVEIGQNQINNNNGGGAVVSTNGTIETFSNNSIRNNGSDVCPCTPVGPGN